jgi:hypothetical protein
MRKIIEYTLVSVDGVFEDPQNWGLRNFQDDAYLRDGLGQLLACDAMLMGRHTYEILAKVYPSRTDPWAVRLNARLGAGPPRTSAGLRVTGRSRLGGVRVPG